MSRYYIDITDIPIPSSDNDYDELVAFADAIAEQDTIDIVRCKECKWKRLYDEGDTKYYYCALEDRPNRQWSIDETDYCSWGERDE